MHTYGYETRGKHRGKIILVAWKLGLTKLLLIASATSKWKWRCVIKMEIIIINGGYEKHLIYEYYFHFIPRWTELIKIERSSELNNRSYRSMTEIKITNE